MNIEYVIFGMSDLCVSDLLIRVSTHTRMHIAYVTTEQ